MSTHTPFLCRVAPCGTPFFVPLETATASLPIEQLTPEAVCCCYWLLETVTVHYKLTFSGSLVVQGNLSLGGMYGTAPNQRLLHTPNFRGSLFHSSTGIQSEGNMDFSQIYLQSDGFYAVDFSLAIYSKPDTIAASPFLVSFDRSEGNNGQRDSYQTQPINFLDQDKMIYLNYSSQIWTSNDIQLNEFSIGTTFYNN